MAARERAASARKQPSQRRSRETVDRILEAAARIFDAEGYRATTTNHVAELAGVSVGSLYQYFPNKDALLVALAERHVLDVAVTFADRLGELRRAAPPIAEVTRSLIELAVERNDTSRLHAVIYAECPRTPELLVELERFTDDLVAEVAWHLECTGNGGVDPHRRAAIVVAAVDAAVHQVVLRRARGPDRDAAVDDLVEFVVHGLGTQVAVQRSDA